MALELKTREADHHRNMDSTRDGYEKRIANMRLDHDRMIEEEKKEIARREEELDLFNQKLLPDEKLKGEDGVSFMKDKIRQLKMDLQGLNDQFNVAVDRTKRQNDENQKIHAQNALINKLKAKIQKKETRTRKQNQVYKDVINKLEKFGYGYQKTFKSKTTGNLKRQVTTKKGKKRSKSLIKAKDKVGIDYAIEDPRKYRDVSTNADTHPRRGRRGVPKKYRSFSRSLTGSRPSKAKNGKPYKTFKTKPTNINQVLIRAQDLTGDKRAKSKKKFKKR